MRLLTAITTSEPRWLRHSSYGASLHCHRRLCAAAAAATYVTLSKFIPETISRAVCRSALQQATAAATACSRRRRRQQQQQQQQSRNGHQCARCGPYIHRSRHQQEGAGPSEPGGAARLLPHAAGGQWLRQVDAVAGAGGAVPARRGPGACGCPLRLCVSKPRPSSGDAHSGSRRGVWAGKVPAGPRCCARRGAALAGPGEAGRVCGAAHQQPQRRAEAARGDRRGARRVPAGPAAGRADHLPGLRRPGKRAAVRAAHRGQQPAAAGAAGTAASSSRGSRGRSSSSNSRRAAGGTCSGRGGGGDSAVGDPPLGGAGVCRQRELHGWRAHCIQRQPS